MANDNYHDLGDVYESLEEMPLSHISREMVHYALGDCKGKVILDIGGGTGLRAREAVGFGAKRVDNVDNSEAMLARCGNEEKLAGRKVGERIACYQADCFRDLDHLSLPGAGDGLYDIIMINWTFDHAGTKEELEGGWKNVGRYCRPGGKVLSLGIKEPLSHTEENHKYGVKLSNVAPVEGGVKFTYSAETSRPFSCDVVAIEAHYDVDQTRAIAAKVGFPRLEEVNPLEVDIVKKDREYWQHFVDRPSFYVLVGNKEG